LAVLLASVIVTAALVGSWTWINLHNSGKNMLAPVEIREYKGQKLDSISDIVDNRINGTQYINQSSYNLIISGLVKNESIFTYDDVVNKHVHYEKVVTLYCVEGWKATILWEGVLVKDLLQDAGYDQTAKVLILYAQDGYSTNLPLSYIINNNIILAYKMNGVVLPAQKGFPFQLVAESQYGYKWIKWITKMEVSNNDSYRGYWESRGYPNNATSP
jgi:DMSO/TMAO reductase YedYZ molybdopterin-dependent catalytic subunit